MTLHSKMRTGRSCQKYWVAALKYLIQQFLLLVEHPEEAKERKRENEGRMVGGEQNQISIPMTIRIRPPTQPDRSASEMDTAKVRKRISASHENKKQETVVAIDEVKKERTSIPMTIRMRPPTLTDRGVSEMDPAEIHKRFAARRDRTLLIFDWDDTILPTF
eukprot:IDg2511t1